MVKQRLVANRVSRHWREVVACTVVAVVLSGCGGGSGMLSSVSSGVSSLGSRFSQIFGSNSQAVGEPQPRSPAQAQTAGDVELTCPPVNIRSGASTMSVGLPGKPPTGSDLRYQLTITRTARDCNLNGGQITARVGIEGRVIVGLAGAPPTVDIPLRVAVVQQGIEDKIIFTKFYKTSVSMAPNADSGVFSFVAEDVIYPTPQGDTNDAYVFYIGFDPNSLKPEPAPRAARRKAKPQG